MTDEPHKLADEQAADSIDESQNGATRVPEDEAPAAEASDEEASAEAPSDTAAADPDGSNVGAKEGNAAEEVVAASQPQEPEPEESVDQSGAQPDAVDRAASEPVAAAEADATPAADETVMEEDESDEDESENGDADEVEADEADDPQSDAEEIAEVEDVAEESADDSPAVEEPAEEDGPALMDWYILKVQSNRERSIADALRRKIAIEGLDEYFGEVVVPTEKVTEFKGGKKKIVERKLYPGYIVVRMHINDDTWFAVRETSGIGDFTGSGGKPTPMLAHEVARIIHTEEEETDETPKLDIKFQLEDKVKVKEGTFEGFEGEVSTIDDQSGKITVMINIFGRSTPVELEYWQVEGV